MVLKNKSSKEYIYLVIALTLFLAVGLSLTQNNLSFTGRAAGPEEYGTGGINCGQACVEDSQCTGTGYNGQGKTCDENTGGGGTCVTLCSSGTRNGNCDCSSSTSQTTNPTMPSIPAPLNGCTTNEYKKGAKGSALRGEVIRTASGDCLEC